MAPPDQTKLARPATGLPRYYMDVGWYRHPRFLGLSLDILFVFEASIAYCYEHGLSGELPAHPDDLAVALGLRASAVKRAKPKLLERGAWETDGDQLAIRNYADHNPTGSEVQRMVTEKSAAGSWGNHKRWHLDRGVTADDCDHCLQSQTASQNGSQVRVADPAQTESHGMGWDGK